MTAPLDGLRDEMRERPKTQLWRLAVGVLGVILTANAACALIGLVSVPVRRALVVAGSSLASGLLLLALARMSGRGLARMKWLFARSR